jgi:hypothetical protein
MVPMSIDDPNNTAKNPATITEADLAPEPRAQSYADSADSGELKRAEEAAHERAMISSLHRAEGAARQLAQIRGGPRPRPVPALALRSDGKTLLSLTDLESADLAGREHWIGVVLTEEEAGEVLGRVAGACDDAAAHIAAAILRKRSTPEDDENRGGGRSK